jgi:AsmA protein
VNVNKISLSRLLPTVDMNKKASVGRIDGVVELKGSGDSVAKMLATANGKAGLVVDGGQISNMMMEIVGIDLWEMLKFKVQGDQPITIRCGVFDAGIKGGTMSTNFLVLDTVDTKVVGSGSLDFAKEQLDMKLEPQPKDKSLISLRTPIHLRGPLAKPDIGPDKGKLAIKGLGALALGAVNPLLAVAALVETGPGVDSDCGKLIQETRATERKPVAPPPR